MMEKPPRHRLTLVLLLTLTAITAWTNTTAGSAAMGSPALLVITLLLLAMAKAMLVAFRFMDLRHAHLFWKSALLLLTGGFLTALAVLAAP
jgi:hypothetical protein